MPKALVIVESPAKAKTIEKFLGKNHYVVKASVGHIRDLPKSRLGVDIDNNFEPEYINIRGKGPIIKDLKKEAKKASKIYLATDPDREGEAISWHLSYLLEIDPESQCRIEFNEITKDTIKKAIKKPRSININLVDAQQARRVLDRLLGYQISPILWQKIRRGLSAGRVQSVTTKLVCDRETEIENFVPVEYWSLDLVSEVAGCPVDFSFYGIDGKKLDLNNEDQVNEIIENIKGSKILVKNIDTKTRKRATVKPFTTSVLQQEAVNRLGFTTRKTMKVAQELYEGVNIKGEGSVGLISYIRTDSQRLSEEAKSSAKDFILNSYGQKYHSTSKDKKSKSKTTIGQYTFKASGSKQVFDGFTKVYDYYDREDKILPEIKLNDKLPVKEVDPKQHFTQPPPRYTEASLVKTLEELGIGRPSTYAPTIGTILTRGYVEKEGPAIKPTELGKIVTDILEENFEMLTDVDYTAQMESRLDKIEEGLEDWKNVVSESYAPLASSIKEAIENIEKINMDEETDEICELCGSNMVIKHGRFGKFMACKNYPECKNTKPIVDKVGVKCPKCGDGDIILRKSKRGRVFYGCSNFPDCDFVEWNKPTGQVCPECGSHMVEKVTKKESKSICSNKDCPTNKKPKKEKSK